MAAYTVTTQYVRGAREPFRVVVEDGLLLDVPHYPGGAAAGGSGPAAAAARPHPPNPIPTVCNKSRRVIIARYLTIKNSSVASNTCQYCAQASPPAFT